MRISFTAALAAAILGVTGCYGQTDFATQIGHDSARLNAHGTADSGPVEPYFEFWKTSEPNVRHTTPVRIFPGGVSGPISDLASNLDDGTEYSYRLCGTDSSTHGFAACAQTLTFVTGLSSAQAYGDTKQQGATFDFDRISVNVRAAPPGGEPSGRVSYRLNDHRPGSQSWDFGSQTEDNINCVRIAGNVAVIGFRQVPPWPSNINFRNDQWVFIVDGGLADSGKDKFAGTVYVTGQGPAANDCSFSPSVDAIGALTHGDAAVSEVQASSPD